MTEAQRAALEAYAAEWLAQKQAADGCPILLCVEVMSVVNALPDVRLPGVDVVGAHHAEP